MCFRYPHFAPTTYIEVRDCANSQAAAQSRRLSFALWSMVCQCTPQQIASLSMRERAQIEQLIWNGWCKQSINLSLSAARHIVERLGGELELIALPCCDSETNWPKIRMRCQSSNSAEIAMVLNHLHAMLPWHADRNGRSAATAWRRRFADIGALSGLSANTVRDAMCFYRQSRFRTLVLIAAAMRHRIHLCVRFNGRIMNAKNDPQRHAEYMVQMRRRSVKLRTAS